MEGLVLWRADVMRFEEGRFKSEITDGDPGQSRYWVFDPRCIDS